MSWDELAQKDARLAARLRYLYLDMGCQGPGSVPARERKGVSRRRAEEICRALGELLQPLPVHLEPYRGAYGAYHGLYAALADPLPLPPPVAPEKEEWIRGYGGEVFREAEAIELWLELSEIDAYALQYWYIWRRGVNSAGAPCRYGDVLRGPLAPAADGLAARACAWVESQGIRILPSDVWDLNLAGARLKGDTAGMAPTVTQMLFTEK